MLESLHLERKHILVVEDDPPTLTLLDKILAGAGYRVTGVPDAMAAIKVAHADPPDLVLLDLVIPGVDGCGACALLKREPSFHAPIVVLSGRPNEKDARAAFDAGADAFLPRPVERGSLLARVAELLKPGPTT